MKGSCNPEDIKTRPLHQKMKSKVAVNNILIPWSLLLSLIRSEHCCRWQHFALTNLLSFKFLLKTNVTAKFNFFNSSEFEGKLYLQLEADLDIVFDTLR